MTDAPERIWADGDETGLDGFCDWLWVRGSWNRSKEGVGEVEYIRADLVEALKAENQQMKELICWAYDTLKEINPSNYNHDDVCALNDASVEVILGLASIANGASHDD